MNADSAGTTEDFSSRPVKGVKTLWIILGVVVAFIIVATWVFRELGIRSDLAAWQQYSADAKARGDDLGASRWAPPEVVDPDDNFAAHPLVAELWESANSPTSRTLAGMDLQSLPGGVRGEVSDSDESWYAEHPDQAVALLEAMKPLEPVFAGFRVAAARKECRFPFDLSKLFEIDGDGRGGRFGAMIRLLAAHAEAALGAGEQAIASADLETLLCLGRHLRSQHNLLLTAVGIGAEWSAREIIATALHRGRWPEDSRARLLAAFAPLNLEEELCDTARLERAGMLELFDRAGPIPMPRPTQGVNVFLWWFYPYSRQVAINKRILCERMDPFLMSGGKEEFVGTMEEKDRSDSRPSKGPFALSYFSMVGGIYRECFQLSTEEVALKKELAASIK